MSRLFFAFTGQGEKGPEEMRITYVGRVRRQTAEADAQRRFQEWQRLSSPLARRRASDQVVVV
jgi:predicted Zn-dependent peptidase